MLSRILTKQLALRVAGWLAVAILLVLVFHYCAKYEADMATDKSEFNCSIANGPVVCR
jgi:hypothetical protein